MKHNAKTFGENFHSALLIKSADGISFKSAVSVARKARREFKRLANRK